MRPAPIIVNWLGYPGTAASPYHDYIIADDFIIPPGFDHYYSETVKRLPCYQPNDRRRDVAPLKSRAEFGLPENGMVYCSFNGVQKITPETWARWMRILHGTAGSVLWLLAGTEQTNAHLVEVAKSHGIDSERIIFAPRMLNADHLARYALVDLFLDSAPYGAHTTASDALWMGVPVLTLVGRGFASRVCGSLCTAAGLADLVCKTADEFVALGIKLGNDRALLAHYQRILRDGRDSCVLFDIDGLVTSIETLYAEMWDEFCSGTLKRPDLRNLPIYAEIGRQFAKEGVEMMLVSDLDQLYRQRLAQWHHSDYIHADSRIWTQDQIDRL
jgi:predicted O-linked N-acetylglucosamine transferase (SPINDLY family)